MYNLHRLRLLRELQLRGTLAAVAAALSYSPSTVSQQLALLEKEAGAVLLERSGRRVRLTVQAQILVGHAEAVFQRLEQAQSDIAASLTRLTGELRVASFQTAAHTLVPAAITELQVSHPDLRVLLTHDEPEHTIPRLLARDFDLVLTEQYPGDVPAASPGTTAQPLCADRLRVAVPAGRPGLAGTAAAGLAGTAPAASTGGPGISADTGGPAISAAEYGAGPEWSVADLAALAAVPWIMEPADSAAGRWARALCRQAGFEPDVRFESADMLLHARMAGQGHAAALLPDLVWADGAPGVTLASLPPEQSTRQIRTVCRAGGDRNPAVTQLRAALARGAATLRTP
ncbi:MAG TPA: LysR substrate-binding domain-containing protein [Streptosporangiaceae bacterium]|jgi:DNA-binding transcriptional LysR family regulator